MAHVVSSVAGQLVPERWVVDLLVLALAALLVVAAALYGLAVVHTRAPTLHQAPIGRVMGGDQEGRAGAIDVYADFWHCQETQ
jgi:hypothetical protein